MKSWPHAPFHSFDEIGTYMVTGATMNKFMFFNNDEELDSLHDLLLELAEHYQWQLEAWAIFPNHYHFIARSSTNSLSLGKWITHLHATSAKQLNEKHQTPGRRIWYQYWDSRITFHKSYLARLNYVMQNPVRHKIVSVANQYKWCSASWFEENATKAFVNTVKGINSDAIHVVDDF